MFIEIEGIDGAGKSTQCQLLQRWMTEKGLASVVVKELGSTSFGKEVRRLLLEDGLRDGVAEMFLFLSCKAQAFSQLIMPSLVQGKSVISDRGSGSFVSYNSSILGLDKETLVNLLRIAMSGVEPTKTILLDIPVEIALERVEMKDKKTRFDMIGKENLIKQRNKFMELAHYFPYWTSIDGSLPIQEVHLEIVRNIEKLAEGA
jgi:dTMP kinase